MRKQIAVCIVAVLLSQFGATAVSLPRAALANGIDRGQHLNAAPPEAAVRLIEQGNDLAAAGRASQAVIAFKRAITLAPDDVWAQAGYIRVMVYGLGRYDDVRTEYDQYIRHEPDNPVYPMALFLGQHLTASAEAETWLKTVADLAPDWSWGHYANGIMLLDRDSEMATAEILRSIEVNPLEYAGYHQAIHFQRAVLKRLDDAIATAEKMSGQPSLHAEGLSELWILRLVKAKFSDEAKQSVKRELVDLSNTSPDIKVLAAVRQAYLDQLDDPISAAKVEARIHTVDPTWYPERGKVDVIAVIGEDGAPRQVTVANRQAAIANKLKAISPNAESDERIAQLQVLLTMNPDQRLTPVILDRLFHAASEARDKALIVKYGEALLRAEPDDWPVALTLATERGDAERISQIAQRASDSLNTFHMVDRPANTDAGWFHEHFTETEQQDNYQQRRALALDALGWTQFEAGNYNRAEATLRRSVEAQWSEMNLNHLAETLQRLGRTDEARTISADARKVFIEGITRRFTSVPSQDLAIEALDGRRYRLSDLKGKVVLLNFWATWCAPCRGEVPLLQAAYDKHKAQGFEIVAISVDDKPSRNLVAAFVKDNRMDFPVGYADGAEDLYNLNSFPTNIFIDREGRIRYRQGGFGGGRVGDDRALEAIISELLK